MKSIPESSLKTIVKIVLPVLAVAVGLVIAAGADPLEIIAYAIIDFVIVVVGTYILLEWWKIVG